MKSCPFFTIARTLLPGNVPGHAICQGEDCAIWNSRVRECSLQDTPAAIDRLAAAILVAGGVPPLEDDKPPS